MLSVSAWTLLAVLGAGGETVLLDFTAPWCGPCRSMAPAIHRLESEGFPVRQIDIDQNPQLASRFGVTGVPCFVMLADGREVGRIEGAVGYDQLTQLFAAARYSPQSASSEAEIRAQSPDRMGLGGRLRQMVGGRRGEPAAPEQPSVSPPASVAATPGDYPMSDAGLEPPAALGLRSAPPPSAPPASSVPAMASAYNSPPPSRSEIASAPAAASQVNAPSASSPSAEQQALAASVRLRIDDGQFFSYATGSVIGVRSGEALVLTCGHVFRDSQGRGAITVERFGAGAQGGVEGRLIGYDLEADLALVSVPAAPGMAPVPVAPRDAYMREGLRVFSIGCDRGAEPSLREGRLAAVNRYLGTPNLVVSGRPVVGRSGGGLFDPQGRLLGVCRAADEQVDEGVYVSYQAVHAQLLEWGAGDVLLQAERASPPLAQQPSPAATAPSQTPAAAALATVADQPAGFDYTQISFESPAGSVAGASSAQNSAPAAALAEAVFVVHAGSNGQGSVMLVERPSQALLEQLTHEAKVPLGADLQLPPAVRMAAEAGGAALSAANPLVRGQSPFPR